MATNQVNIQYIVTFDSSTAYLSFDASACVSTLDISAIEINETTVDNSINITYDISMEYATPCIG